MLVICMDLNGPQVSEESADKDINPVGFPDVIFLLFS